METIRDYEVEAAKKLPEKILIYYNSGAADGETLRENSEAYKRWRFRPRVMRDVAKVDASTNVLGSKIPFPICVAPTAYHQMANQDGEIVTAQAVEKLGTGMVLSMTSSRTMEEVAECAPTCLRWCHMQVYGSKKLMRHIIGRAEENGYSGLVITVDRSTLGRRTLRSLNDLTDFRKPRSLLKSVQALETGIDVSDVSQLRAFLYGISSEWEIIDWIKTITKLPILIKGILTGEMACEALDHGADGILVSNHGGRQLDGTFATIDALTEVVDAVKGQCDVYLDGGIRKGSDVAKAIALGAKAVFVGRPVLWGLACEGEDGVCRVLEILRDEFISTMKLLGVKSIKELQEVPNLVVHESYTYKKSH